MLKFIQLQLQSKSRGRIMIGASVVMAVMLLLVITRVWAAIQLRQNTNAMAVPLVRTITAVASVPTERIILPGSVMAWHEAPIYARTNGYVKKWYVDIGDSVNKGDLLADIETPELDAQLRQAHADLNVVIEQHELAKLTMARWLNLVKTDYVSKQAADEKVHKAAALAASILAARAKEEHLREQVGFERVTAPFKGIVSARGVDVGDLINAGGLDSTKPLFRVVQSDPLRLYVKIPETDSSRVKPNMNVELSFAEHSGQTFKAQLIKTANAIDPVTRTLLAEFLVDNKHGKLMPGSYTKVEFSMPASSERIMLPVNTLIFRAEGLQVAVVDKSNHVVLKNITIRTDYGTHVELSSGINAGEQIIINPSDSIYNGERVRIAFAGIKHEKKQHASTGSV